MLLNPKDSVLFVCLGNYCRSPMAEGAFREEMRKIGYAANCDSAGTDPYQTGSAPDWRAQTVARRDNIDISNQRSRQVCQNDFHRFTLILAMDAHNLRDLLRIAPSNGRAQVSLFLDVVTGAKGRSVRDPYKGNIGDFAQVWRTLRIATRELARDVIAPVV